MFSGICGIADANEFFFEVVEIRHSLFGRRADVTGNRGLRTVFVVLVVRCAGRGLSGVRELGCRSRQPVVRVVLVARVVRACGRGIGADSFV